MSDPDRLSLPDTKTAEDLAEQILAGKFPGDFAQAALREAQILGEQFEGASAAQGVRGILRMLPRPAQGIEMAAPCGESAGLGFLIAGGRFQMAAQQVQPIPRAGAQENPRGIRNLIEVCRCAAQVDFIEDQGDRDAGRQRLQFRPSLSLELPSHARGARGTGGAGHAAGAGSPRVEHI